MAEPHRPMLTGKSVVVTRVARQSAALIAALTRQGALAISLPLIQVLPPSDFSPLDAALRRMAEFDWLIFTSQNAVVAVADRLAELGIHVNSLGPSLKIAAVGRSTAEAAAGSGLAVSHIGSGGTAADLVRELAQELAGQNVFLPRSDQAAARLVTQMVELKASVTDVVAYRVAALDSVDAAGRSSVATASSILFFSPSAVRAFRGLVDSGVLSSLRDATVVGAIGPVTASALKDAGIKCDFQAAQQSAEEIVSALAAHFASGKASAIFGAISR